MQIGSKIIFTGCCEEQRKWGNHADDSVLEIGKEYTVKDISVHSYHTKIYLEETEGHFNSVCFELEKNKNV